MVNFKIHTFAAAFLFVLGNKVMVFSLQSGSLVFYLLSAVFVLLFSTLLLPCGKNNTTIFYIQKTLVFCAAIYGVVTSFIDLFLFCDKVLLPKTKGIFIITLLIFTILFFATRATSAILKFCLFSAVVCGGVIIICFVSGIKSFSFDGISPLLKFDFKIKGFFDVAIPVFVLPSFAKEKSGSIKPAFCGIAAAFLALLLCAAQSFLTLGVSNADYPYLKAVSVISSGSLFTRLDGLVFFLFFATCAVRIALCVKVAKECLFLVVPNKNGKCKKLN